jgi:spore coat protein JB
MFDLDLYLDTHPDDAEKIKAYNQFMLQEHQARNEYETRYGPLSLGSEVLNSHPWAWTLPPWPWEVM